MLEKIQNPILFQGNVHKTNYFEGWYYKQVSADQKTSLSFIPGISLNKGDEHSFIQYILVQRDENDETTTQTGYIRYRARDFLYKNNPFHVTIGESTFSEKQIKIDLVDDDFRFTGAVKLGALHPIETTPLQPNIMGIFGYIPKMECYHGVISMQHSLNGFMRINGEKIDFTGGTGYIEKDWGTSFPKYYIWMQSNHFENKTASLFFSVAHVPFYGIELEGFICNFVFDGKEYRFATYNQSTCSIKHISEDSVTIQLESKQAHLTIHAKITDQGELIAPVQGTMQKTIKEGIAGVLNVHFTDKVTGQVFDDKGENAGIEIVDYM